MIENLLLFNRLLCSTLITVRFYVLKTVVLSNTVYPAFSEIQKQQQLIQNNIRCTTFCWTESALNIRFNEKKKCF